MYIYIIYIIYILYIYDIAEAVLTATDFTTTLHRLYTDYLKQITYNKDWYRLLEKYRLLNTIDTDYLIRINVHLDIAKAVLTANEYVYIYNV